MMQISRNKRTQFYFIIVINWKNMIVNFVTAASITF